MTNDPVKILVTAQNWPIEFWIPGATCHMTPEVSDFITNSLEDRDKHIEVADRHHITAKKMFKYK